MSAITSKTALVYCEDKGVLETTLAALKPVMKNVLVGTNPKDALAKLEMQPFDCVIYRSAHASLADPKGFFQIVQLNKKLKKTHWIILGKDIEDEQIVVSHRSVKFVEKADDSTALLRLLDGLFFSTQSDAPRIDANFINPIMSAVIEVINSMASIELKRGTPSVKKTSGSSAASGDISGVIAMNSDRFIGSFAICLQESLALKIYENMIGTALPSINDDIKDAVSELTNVIFGTAKRDLNADGHTISPAIPSVISGKGHEIRHSATGVCFTVPFESPYGACIVECVISMKGNL